MVNVVCWDAWLVMACMLVSMGLAWSAVPPVTAPTATDCGGALARMKECKSYVEERSKKVKPEGKCCSGLKKVVKEEVGCLCEAFKFSGVKLNVTRALALPHVCGVMVPFFSGCQVAGGSGLAPAPSPGSLVSSSFSEVPAPAPATASNAILLLTSYMSLFGSVAISLS